MHFQRGKTLLKCCTSWTS